MYLYRERGHITHWPWFALYKKSIDQEEDIDLGSDTSSQGHISENESDYDVPETHPRVAEI